MEGACISREGFSSEAEGRQCREGSPPEGPPPEGPPPEGPGVPGWSGGGPAGAMSVPNGEGGTMTHTLHLSVRWHVSV